MEKVHIIKNSLYFPFFLCSSKIRYFLEPDFIIMYRINTK